MILRHIISYNMLRKDRVLERNEFAIQLNAFNGTSIKRISRQEIR